VPREGNVMLSKYQGFVDDQQGEHNEMIKRHYEVLSHSVGDFLVQTLLSQLAAELTSDC
jgi:esterase/lipase superfamily enzyme